MDESPQKLTALIITYNEIDYIADCLHSLQFADEVIVVDSYSTDGTYEYLLGQPGVKVIQHPFKNFTSQRNVAIAQASHDWILFIDADEVIPDGLAGEILEIVADTSRTYQAFWVYRKFMYQRKPLRFSGWQTDRNIRLFRKGMARFNPQRTVHEKLEVSGKTGRLSNRLVHYSFKDAAHYRNKMILYGRFKAEEAFEQGETFSYAKTLLKFGWKFLYNYLVRGGILDGKKGLVICYLDAYSIWARYAHLAVLERAGHVRSETVLSTTSS